MRSVRSAQGPTVDGDSPSGQGVHLQDASDEQVAPREARIEIANRDALRCDNCHVTWEIGTTFGPICLTCGRKMRVLEPPSALWDRIDGRTADRNPLNVIAENMAVDTNETVHRILDLMGQTVTYDGPNSRGRLLVSGSDPDTLLRCELVLREDGSIEVSVLQQSWIIWRTYLTRRR